MDANARRFFVSPLRARRQRAGLSMEQLAVRAGISRATLYWAEKAPHLMSDRTAKAVAEVLGLYESIGGAGRARGDGPGMEREAVMILRGDALK